jgi:hypothetical protein
MARTEDVSACLGHPQLLVPWKGMGHSVSYECCAGRGTAGGTGHSVSSATNREKNSSTPHTRAKLKADGHTRDPGILTCQTNGRLFKLITARIKARVLHEASDIALASISRIFSIRRGAGIADFVILFETERKKKTQKKRRKKVDVQKLSHNEVNTEE